MALTLVGAAIRLRGVGRLGLEHFDEGIYAFAGLWSLESGGLWDLSPDLIAYAPPGFPVLVGLAYAILGVSDLATISVSLLAGIATIPVVGWIGRRTFGPGVGVAAAAFVAFAGPHVAFSRMGLTDSSFLLAWLIALGLGARFLERPTVGRSLALGLAVGLAQNLKYNGWLAGAIVGLTAILDLCVRRPVVGRDVGRVLGQGALAAIVAALAYLPWYLFVERNQGYSALLAHHRGYLGGVSTWWPHLKLQLAEGATLSGGMAWNALTWAIAWSGWMFVAVSPRQVSGWTAWIKPVGVLAGGSLIVALDPRAVWWLGLAASPWLLRDRRPGVRLLGVTWLSMSILTPFYRPYARLWLPLHAAGWLILAWGLSTLGRVSKPAFPSDRPNLLRWGITLASLAILVLALAGPASERRIPFDRLLDPTDGFKSIAAALESGSSRLPGDGLLTLARPPLVFYLALGGKIQARPLDNVGALHQPGARNRWALVDELQLRQAGDPDQIVAELRPRWRIEQVFEDRPNLPTLLDVDPNAAFGPLPTQTSRIFLLAPILGTSESAR